MKRYPHYKDSGVPWLGEIPTHWSVKRLKFLDEVIMGQSPPSANYNNNEKGLPFLQGNADFSNLYPKPRIWCDNATKVSERHDVLVSVRAPIGAVNLSDRQYGIGRGLCAIRGKRNLPKILYYLFLSLNDELNSIGTGSTYTAISVDDVRDFKIPVISAEEQAVIVKFLDQQTAVLDTLIAKKRQLIELLREERTAVINAAVTGQFDTRSEGLERYGRYKDSGIEWLGPIPEHWKVVPLKHLAYVQTGTAKGRDFGTDKTTSLPYMRVANVQDGYIDLRDVATITIRESEVARYSLQKGDVLMNEGGDNDKLGRGAVWEGEIEPCIHQNHVFAVRPHNQALSAWIALIILTNYAKTYFRLSANQSTNLASISSSNLKLLPVIKPPYLETVAIAEFVCTKTAQIDQAIAKTEQQITLLQEYRTALISAAVTGQIDVR
jgi:type I restriction enzyme, S subunit